MPRRPFPPVFRRQVEQYLRGLQDVLRLADWTLAVDWATPAPADCYACIVPMENSRHARVRLHPVFVTLTPTEQRHTLVHELMHCHLFALHHLAVEMVDVHGPRKGTRVADRAVTIEVERTVDALADAFAPTCPPVPWA